jgi:DNA-binding transcriptional LysR family regulator
VLESELGGALFYRARARTRLTGLGERVRPSFEQAWRHVQAVECAARETARQQGAQPVSAVG